MTVAVGTPVPAPPGAIRSGAPTSILQRLLVGLTVTVGLISMLVVAIFAIVVIHNADARVARDVDVSVREAAQLLESPLWHLDLDRATRIAEAFGQDPRISSITIREATTGASRTIERLATSDATTRTRRVTHEGRVVGEVRIVFDHRSYLAQAWRQVFIAIGVSLMALLATLFGVRLLLRRLLRRPLAEMAKVVSAYAEGRYLSPDVEVAEFQPLLTVLAGMGDRITGQLRALTLANEQLAALNRFLAVAAEDRAAGELLEQACRELSTILGLSSGVAFLLDELDASMHVVAQVNPDPGAMAVGSVVSVGAAGSLRRIIREGAPIVASDVRTDARFAGMEALFEPTGVAALIGLPLVVHGSMVGALVLTSRHPRQFSEAELALASGVSTQAGSALSRHRARTAERMLRAAIEQIPEGVLMTDPAGRIEYVNPAFTTTTGLSSQMVLGRHSAMLAGAIHGDIVGEEIRQSLDAGRAWQGRLTSTHQTGEPLQLDALIMAVRNERGELAHYVGIARDITQELERESHLLHAQKLEAVGQLAGGIAHDFNNIMGAMLMEVDLIQVEQSLPDEVGEGLRNLRASIDRAAGLTRQLLLFGRRQTMTVQHHDLGDIVNDLLRMLTRVIGEAVEIEFVRHETPVRVNVDAGMIEQVLTNLAVNARDAMKGVGQLTIAVERACLEEHDVEARPEARAGLFASLRVTDTGTGMAPAVVERIFEPFFTTKGVGEGSGLGLATTYGIIAQHNGWIEVDSAPGSGTTFEIFLPLADQAAPVAAPHAPAPSVRGGNEAILVVEDETLLRTMISRALRHLGYRVFEATSGVNALAIWTDLDGAVDVLLTDMVMPYGISGMDLASRLREQKPALEVIVMSGYSVELAQDGGGMAARDVRFLGKPFTIAALSETVRSALDRSEQRLGTTPE